MSKIGVFLPCRSGSKRVKKKNIRRFCDYDFGLLELKLTQLSQCTLINRVYLSTDDEEIIVWFRKQGARFPNCVLDLRPKDLCLSSTPTFDLVSYSHKIIEEEIILWTHVTSPFFSRKHYESAIQLFIRSKEYDSLVSYYPMKKFLWDSLGPRNYDPTTLGIWPNTQDIPELYEINSAIFMYYNNNNNKWGRVGSRPYFLRCDWRSSFDIDTEEDFVVAEKLFKL